MIRPDVPRVAVLALLTAFGVGGCLGGGARNEPIRYWVLNALPGPPESGGDQRILGVGPIGVPDHLNRPGIVLREGENQLRISTLDQWGEPLVRGMQRVIAENLAVLSPGLEVVTFPWKGPVDPDLQISIAIVRLDARQGGDVELVASWLITRPIDGVDLAIGSTRLREPVAGDAVADVVASLSRLIERWSRELLTAVDAAVREAASPSAS